MVVAPVSIMVNQEEWLIIFLSPLMGRLKIMVQ